MIELNGEAHAEVLKRVRVKYAEFCATKIDDTNADFVKTKLDEYIAITINEMIANKELKPIFFLNKEGK